MGIYFYNQNKVIFKEKITVIEISKQINRRLMGRGQLISPTSSAQAEIPSGAEL